MADAKTSKTKYGSIAEALVAFQSDIPSVTKNASADTGKYGYEYASLDYLTPIVLKALTDVGIAYTAAPDVKDGIAVLNAQLIHESGTAIGGNYPLGNPNIPAQSMGSAITYARRYALLALTGVAPGGEDDDGAAASSAQAAAEKPAEVKQTSAQALRAEMGALITAENKITGEDANGIMQEIAPGKEPKDWTAADLKKGKAAIEALIEERK